MPTFTENTTSQNSADTPTTGVTEVQKFGVADHGHTVIRFDTTGESGTVSSATLYLYQEGNNGEAHDVAVRELLQTGWVESQVNWNDYSTGNSWNTGGALGAGTDRVSTPEDTVTVPSTTGSYVSWDVTGIVSANLGGSIEFHLELDEVGNAGDYTWWATSEGTDGERPELVVVYSGAAAVPQAAFNYRLRR